MNIQQVLIDNMAEEIRKEIDKNVMISLFGSNTKGILIRPYDPDEGQWHRDWSYSPYRVIGAEQAGGYIKLLKAPGKFKYGELLTEKEFMERYFTEGL